MTVGKNSYVSLFRHHYSVPREYVGRRVTILYDAGTVEIYCGMNLVATHDRCDIPYTYSWKKEYNLPRHYGSYDKDLEELFRYASEMDNIVLNYLREVCNILQRHSDPAGTYWHWRRNMAVTVWLRPARAQTKSCNTGTKPCARCLNWERMRISFPMKTGRCSLQRLPQFRHPTKIYADVNIIEKTNTVSYTHLRAHET